MEDQLVELHHPDLESSSFTCPESAYQAHWKEKGWVPVAEAGSKTPSKASPQKGNRPDDDGSPEAITQTSKES